MSIYYAHIENNENFAIAIVILIIYFKFLLVTGRYYSVFYSLIAK